MDRISRAYLHTKGLINKLLFEAELIIRVPPSGKKNEMKKLKMKQIEIDLPEYKDSRSTRRKQFVR